MPAIWTWMATLTTSPSTKWPARCILNGEFYDDIRLSKIAKTVTFKTSRSDMEIASVPGDMEIATATSARQRPDRPQPGDHRSKNITSRA